MKLYVEVQHATEVLDEHAPAGQQCCSCWCAKPLYFVTMVAECNFPAQWLHVNAHAQHITD
jgi:hypothetical protein